MLVESHEKVINHVKVINHESGVVKAGYEMRAGETHTVKRLKVIKASSRSHF